MTDYLWDGSGKPDPETQRLEKLLGQFRHNRPAPDFSQIPIDTQDRVRSSWLRTWWSIPRFAAATAVVILAAGSWYAYRISRPAWNVVRVTGTPQVGSRSIHTNGRLGIGDSLQTDANSSAQISVGAVGTVDVEPNTLLRLLQARTTDHRLALDRGTIHAYIWAPPRLFTVNTPSAVAVDLGCEYTLHVEPNGNGELRVTYGWVAFEQNGHESFVPANAMAMTRTGFDPGTPFYEDATPALRDALEKLDFARTAGTASTLDVVLHNARPRDALTLWHLLSRTEGAERARVYDRLAQLVPPPPGVTREGLLSGDQTTQRAMRDLWWDTLGLGDTSWWRIWKGPVPTR